MVGGDVGIWVAGVFAKIARAQRVEAKISTGPQIVQIKVFYNIQFTFK
jgi:hypothetical protein